MAGLYIHIPFCAQKCRYCDFVSFAKKQDSVDTYFAALASELEIASKLHTFKGVSTIFFGGGTPSFVPSEHIASTMEAARKHFDIARNAEVTLEANPCTLTKQKLYAYQAAGINRLSIGLQSADNGLLDSIGRLHTAEQFHLSYNMALQAGFRNINIDLIYALPGQTLESFRQTLAYAASLKPTHLSVYSLKLEPGTPLYDDFIAGKIFEADEDLEREMNHLAAAMLQQNGYEQYEISNFAKPGFACRHNLIYWNREDYLGVGLAAHSCIRNVRFSNTSDMDEFLCCLGDKKTAYNNREELDMKQQETEYIMLKLRLKKGFLLKEYNALFNRNFEELYKIPLIKLMNAGLLRIENGSVFATEKGFDLQNLVVLELVNIL